MNQGRIIVITGAPGTGKTTNTVEKRKEIINGCFSSKRKNSKRYGFTILDNFQFIGGMKVGEPSADGRGSAPPELAEQQARAGSEAAPATPPL